MKKFFEMLVLVRWSVVVASMCVLAAAPVDAQQRESVVATHVAGTVHRIDGVVDVVGASIGPDGLLLVDPGYARTVTALRSVLRSLATDRPRLLINTHWHHAFANDSLGPHTVVVAHQLVRERLGRSNDMAGRVIPPAPAAARPVVTFEDSLTVHFNGERITLLHLPNAHTDGDIAVIFHGSKVVMTGDVYVPHLPWIDRPSGGHLDGLLEATDLLLRVIPRDAKVIPGHGPTGTYNDVVRFRDMLEDNVGAVRRQIAAGRSLAEIQATGVPERWRSWEGAVPQRMFLESLYYGLTERRTERDASVGRTTPGKTYELRNGRWFTGRGFQARTWYAVDGVLRSERPARVDSVIDLTARFIVPPYGDAHVHDVNDTATLASEIRQYLSRGVFYLMEQDPKFAVTRDVLDRVNVPTSVDVAYTRGVVTPSWGMIAALYRMLAEQGQFGSDVALASIDTRNVFIVDDSADLARKWPLLAAMNRDFVKVIVGFSEEFDARRSWSSAAGSRPNTAAAGLDPALLPALVRRAHAAGLRVSAHIETAEDFRRAVAAGVDLIAHWPGAWQIGPKTGFPAGDLRPWKLSESDAVEAARRGIVVVSTIMRDPARPDRREYDEVHRHNLRLLARSRVRIALGSDQAPGGTPAEARYIAALGVLDRLSVLRLLVDETPRAIFPQRRIGRLEPGNEASFLALSASPLDDLANLDRIALRMKQGVLLPAHGDVP